MKTAKPPAPEGPAAGPSRRAQPVRQTRTNPPRTSSLNRGNSFTGAPAQEQPIDIFPAITHFADAITALPKELVRHFTLLKEVDAKVFAPEASLFQLLEAALNTPVPDPARSVNDAATPASGPLSAHNSSHGGTHNAGTTVAASVDGSVHTGVFDPGNLHRRQLFRQTALQIQEMLVSLEEKNHVLSTANDALQKQLGRIEEIWPHLEDTFSDEAKWGSTTHWAYVENRPSKTSNAQAERSRREGAATLSAAAQQLAEEAAARSTDRKQALAAKKNSRAQATEGDPEAKQQEPSKKSHGNGKSRKPPADATAPIGLGISGPPTAAANPRSKGRAKVADRKPEESIAQAPMERAMMSVFGTSAPKPKTTSPRETPVPEGASKKRKALPTSSGQAKKSRTNATMSPSVASSPLIGTFPDSIKIGRSSPVPLPNPPRPASARARQNSAQLNNAEHSRQRPASAASNKPNGAGSGTPDPGAHSNGTKTTTEPKVIKETAVPIPIKTEASRPEIETPVPPPPEPPVSNGSNGKKEGPAKVNEDREPKRDSATPIVPPTPITAVKTKSGRASKPSTPALATFAEAAAASSNSNSRSRPSRNADGSTNNGNGNGAVGVVTATTTTKRSHKKGASISASAAAAAGVLQVGGHQGSAGAAGPGGEDSSRKKADSSRPARDDDDDEPDGDEPRYCFCNQVSYGEMVGCDADGCPREWFHLECVGLEVAPKGKGEFLNQVLTRALLTKVQRNGTARTAKRGYESRNGWGGEILSLSHSSIECMGIPALFLSICMHCMCMYLNGGFDPFSEGVGAWGVLSGSPRDSVSGGECDATGIGSLGWDGGVGRGRTAAKVLLVVCRFFLSHDGCWRGDFDGSFFLFSDISWARFVRPLRWYYFASMNILSAFGWMSTRKGFSVKVRCEC
ncbi:transcriptional regulatory protein PHO23 [Echria macrotheca]|uniref:Transcriptional regulatory protein PHO23 n=1 Tax=Echria macrotheca TaxID=438768 RepID=A0AAJ0FBF3_9PEZI|nr:transcriptional regulatory protein PHO23 [Echria macrotheca]